MSCRVTVSVLDARLLVLSRTKARVTYLGECVSYRFHGEFAEQFVVRLTEETLGQVECLAGGGSGSQGVTLGLGQGRDGQGEHGRGGALVLACDLEHGLGSAASPRRVVDNYSLVAKLAVNLSLRLSERCGRLRRRVRRPQEARPSRGETGA